VDNGRKQTIQGIEVIDLETLEPGASRVEIEGAVPAAARRYFLLLFDHSFANPGSIRRAQEASRRFVVESLHPTDLVAVAVLSPETGPSLVVTFTPDRAQIARGIDAVASTDLIQQAESQDPLRFLIQASGSATGTMASQEATVSDEYFQDSDGQIQGYLDVIRQQAGSAERSFDRGKIESWSAAMSELGKALNSLRGRKYVVYFSEGFDSQLLYGQDQVSSVTIAGQELSPLEQNQFGVLDTEDVYGSGGLRNSVDGMLQEFRRSDSVIEAIDISARESGGGSTSSNQGSLFYLANETGGEFLSGGGKLDDQLQVMLRRSAVTYLLTFQPNRVKQDGSYHRLKVKADLPTGARLTHRAGYYAPRPFEELHRVEKDLLIADAIAGATPSSDVSVNVLAAPFPANEARAYVPVVLEIAGESLLVGHEEEHLPIEIYAYVSDQYGEMRDFFTHVLTFNLAGRWDAFRGSGLKYYGHVDLDAGTDYLLRVVVRNGRTGRTGVETLPLDVPDYSNHAPVMLPPFFVEPPARWFMVREQPPKGMESDWIVYPFTIHGEPFVPAVAPVVGRDEEIELCLIAYNLGVEEPELSGRVLSKGGGEVEGGTFALTDHIIATQSGVDKMVVRFRPEGLAPGDYDLLLDLLDPSWSSPAQQQVSITVID
jgi:VWFA-related protein